MDRDGFSPWEEIIVLGLIAIFIGVVYHRYEILKRRALRSKVEIELQNLRLAVELYRLEKGKNPPNLYVLYKDGFIYYRGFLVNKRKRELLDELGNAFVYDNKTGFVKLNPKSVEKLFE